MLTLLILLRQSDTISLASIDTMDSSKTKRIEMLLLPLQLKKPKRNAFEESKNCGNKKRLKRATSQRLNQKRKKQQKVS